MANGDGFVEDGFVEDGFEEEKVVAPAAPEKSEFDPLAYVDAEEDFSFTPQNLEEATEHIDIGIDAGLPEKELDLRSRQYDRFKDAKAKEDRDRVDVGLDEESSALGAFALGNTQGLSFGFADELSAAFKAIKPGVSLEEFKKDYVKNRDYYRKILDETRTESPIAYGTGQVAGGVVQGALGAGGVTSVGGLAGVGAAEGALAGFGEAQGTPGEQLQSTAIGAGLGGVIGAAIPLGVQGAKKFVKGPVRKWLTGLSAKDIESIAKNADVAVAGRKADYVAVQGTPKSKPSDINIDDISKEADDQIAELTRKGKEDIAAAAKKGKDISEDVAKKLDRETTESIVKKQANLQKIAQREANIMREQVVGYADILTEKGITRANEARTKLPKFGTPDISGVIDDGGTIDVLLKKFTAGVDAETGLPIMNSKASGSTYKEIQQLKTALSYKESYPEIQDFITDTLGNEINFAKTTGHTQKEIALKEIRHALSQRLKHLFPEYGAIIKESEVLFKNADGLAAEFSLKKSGSTYTYTDSTKSKINDITGASRPKALDTLKQGEKVIGADGKLIERAKGLRTKEQKFKRGAELYKKAQGRKGRKSRSEIDAGVSDERASINEQISQKKGIIKKDLNLSKKAIKAKNDYYDAEVKGLERKYTADNAFLAKLKDLERARGLGGLQGDVAEREIDKILANPEKYKNLIKDRFGATDPLTGRLSGQGGQPVKEFISPHRPSNPYGEDKITDDY